MAKLTATQLVVLSAASLRPRHLVLPLPERLRGGAAAKVVRGLLSRGLAREVRPRGTSRSGARRRTAGG